MLVSSGFTSSEFSLASLQRYTKEFEAESIGVCSSSSTKTYEDYRAINNTASAGYKYIHEHCTVDETTGFIYDEDGFIAVALGYLYGDIGSRYYFTLDTGIVIPVVKVDAKAAIHAENGCSAGGDASVIEFVIDSVIAKEYFASGNGLASWGNFNNYEYLQGNIVDVELVSDEKIEEGIIYDSNLVDFVKELEESDGNQLVVGGFNWKARRSKGVVFLFPWEWK